MGEKTMKDEYTLRNDLGGLKQEIYPLKFNTYEKAYDKMCELYVEEKRKGTPKCWKIWETSYGIGNNSFTKQV